jgi:hypothetical protein
MLVAEWLSSFRKTKLAYLTGDALGLQITPSPPPLPLHTMGSKEWEEERKWGIT